MTGRELQVSIVIPTYNGGSLFEDCLARIFEQQVEFVYEVIVIDSGSIDGTLQILKKYPVQVSTIPNSAFNHGSTRNRGIEISSGELVVLITQDAIPANDYWLSNLVKNFEDKAVAGVYCRQVPRETADVLTKRNLDNWLAGRPNRVVNYVARKTAYACLTPMERLQLCTIDNVCCCIRKSVWEKTPFVKANFAEDLEWGKEVILAGYKIVYEPEAVVVHSHDRSVLYEYKRTYLCHRRLYQLHGLHTIPKLKYAFSNYFNDVVTDARYVLIQEKNRARALLLLLKLPILSLAKIVGQYKGAKDEKYGHTLKTYKDV
ncbi:glycosyltransferase [Gammaproteobacteria bacterium]|nr:glycosyltransferase [Gammaproteobacteria bacterium]